MSHKNAMLSESDRKIVARFKELLAAAGIYPLQMIVFGSRARGEAWEESDLDVLIVVETLDAELRERISDCAWEAGFEAGIYVETVVMTRDEIENSPERSSLFMIGVREDGIPV